MVFLPAPVILPCTSLQCDEMWGFCYAKQRNVPDECKGTFGYGDVWTWVALDADTKLVPTWLVGERNLTVLDLYRRPQGADVGMRRFTRLTNAFSKKVENLAHAVSLHYMHYNFARVHRSLTITNDDGTTIKRTPAMAAGVTDHVWTLTEIAGMLD